MADVCTTHQRCRSCSCIGDWLRTGSSPFDSLPPPGTTCLSATEERWCLCETQERNRDISKAVRGKNLSKQVAHWHPTCRLHSTLPAVPQALQKRRPRGGSMRRARRSRRSWLGAWWTWVRVDEIRRRRLRKREEDELEMFGMFATSQTEKQGRRGSQK